jgi:hypothetical protein
MRTAKQLANLKPPFKKGEIHNPKGRPKLPHELRIEMLKEVPALNKVVLARAKKGDMRAAKIWYDRTLPTYHSVEVDDKTENITDDLSGLTEDQVRAIAEKEAEIDKIKAGGK